MPLLALALLQSGAVAAGSAQVDTFDLRNLPHSDPCATQSADDIIVCARLKPDRFRLPPLDTKRFEGDGKAQTSIEGNLTGAAEVESAQIAPGIKSNRMMVRLKLPF